MSLFNESYYLSNNPDVLAAVEAGLIPSALWHFENFGWQEGRNPSAFFDVSLYLEQNSDVAEAGINPLTHFEEFGWKEGRNPNSSFDVGFYLAENPDVAEAGINPLEHFLNFGASEGRAPNPQFVSFAEFDTQAYLAANPDLAEAGLTTPESLYGHFVTFGFREDRPGSTTKSGSEIVEGVVVNQPDLLDPDDADDSDDEATGAPPSGGGGGGVIDTTPPTLTIGVEPATLAAGDTATVTFSFSEAVTGFAVSDIEAPNGTISDLTTTDDITFTATFTPDAGFSGDIAISVAEGAYSDPAGNPGGGATSPDIAIDTEAPSLTITLDDANLAAGETASVSFTFSEPPVGFEASDVVVTNGTLSDFAATTDPLVYTATFTPTPGFEGAAAISVAAGAYADAAGNPGLAAGAPTITVDTVAPTLTIGVDPATLAAGDTATVTFSFSEAVTGFAVSDIEAPNGTISDLTTTDDITFTTTFTPDAGFIGDIAISVAEGAYSDPAGNPGGGATSPDIAIDTVLVPALYFSANDGETGTELWKVDDTGEVSLFKDINTGSGSFQPLDFTEFNGALYFRANDGVNGTELWKVDDSGEVSLVKDIRPGIGWSDPTGFTEFNGALYFSAFGGGTGRELWKVDDTGGVSLVEDINLGSGSSSPSGFTIFDPFGVL